MTSDTKENNNMTTHRETSIGQCHSQCDNSIELETENSVTGNNNEDHSTTNNESSVINPTDDDYTKIIHNLENVTPIEIYSDDNTDKQKGNEISFNDNIEFEDAQIFNNTAEPSSVIIRVEDESDINKGNNDLRQIQVAYKAEVSNDVTYNTDVETFNVIDNETMESLKEFEEALTNCFISEFINIDDFNEIFDKLDDVNNDLISVGTVFENNESANYCKEKEITHENIDVISINSSTDDEKSQAGEIKQTIFINIASDESDSDDGYNSSDFEFISETEANMAGFIINYGLKNYQNLSQASSEPLSYYSGQYFDDEGEKEPSDPGEGSSRQNRPRNEFEDRSYRNDHNIPIGDDYLGLFQGIYNPLLPMSEIYFLENKSVRASAMNSQYDGIGFDKQLALRRHQPDSSEDEFEDEAKESAKMILKMYPGENKKRRRRY